MVKLSALPHLCVSDMGLPLAEILALPCLFKGPL